MSLLLHDVRYGVRTFRKNAGVTSVALLTLAICIGANTAVFSIVDAVLLEPLPYPHADRIVGIWERRPGGPPTAMSTLNYLDYASQSTVFEHIAATTGCCAYVMLGDGPAPVRLIGLHVSPPFFDILGVKTALGRTFLAGDDQPGRDHVVVLSHKLWAARFGSDATLVGRSIRLDGEPYTVVGVMPENSPFDRTSTEIWLPLSFAPDRMYRDAHWLLSLTGGALALLKPGVTLERARAEMQAIGARLSTDYPNTNKGWSSVVEPYASIVVGKDLRQSLYLLFAAVGMVLLIGCVNLANVMLARSLARDHEVTVRLALGAGRGRLFQQFLTESVLLSLAGGLLGLVAGYVTAGVLRDALIGLPLNPSMPPNLVPAEAVIGLDPRVLIFTLTLSLVCGVGFGLAPAVATLRATRLDAMNFGRRATATVAHRRLRGALIVAEVALAFVLLAGAGLLIRSFFKMRQADTGFDATNVLTAEIPTREHRFASADELHGFMREISTRVEALPGVSDVAFTDGMPLHGTPTLTFFRIAGHPPVNRAQRPVSNFKVVSPAYFRALGLRLRRGRTLSDLDRTDTPLVAVINETMARLYFANEEPVGQRLLMEQPRFGRGRESPEVPWEVVGVIADERLTPFDDKREHPAVYVTTDQSPTGFAGLVLRASLDPSRMEEALRRVVAAVDKDQPVTDVKTLEHLKSESLAPDRLRSLLLGLFAAIALLLSAIGIYGVISYTVVQRTHEIGIRSAIGASAGNLLRLVVGGGMALAGLGLALGCAAALGMTRLVATFLFGVQAWDPLTLIATAGVLAGVAAIACYLPARNATRINPLDALRAE